MTTIKEYTDGTILELAHAQMSNAGYGHKRITVKLSYRDEEREFSRTTDNMSETDRISNMEDCEEMQMSLYYFIAYSIKNELIEWMFEIDKETNS